MRKSHLVSVPTTLAAPVDPAPTTQCRFAPRRVSVVDSVTARTVHFRLFDPWPERRDLRLEELRMVSRTVEALVAAQGEIFHLIHEMFMDPVCCELLMELIVSRALQRELQRRLLALGYSEAVDTAWLPQSIALDDYRISPRAMARIDEFEDVLHAQGLQCWHAFSLMLHAAARAREQRIAEPSVDDVSDWLREISAGYSAVIDRELENFDQAVAASVEGRILVREANPQVHPDPRIRAVAMRYRRGRR